MIVSQRNGRTLEPVGPSVASAEVTPLSNTDLQQLEKQISTLSETVEQKKTRGYRAQIGV